MSASEDEDVGPSVDSADPEERIQARRIRIQKRIEAQRRSEMGGDLTDKQDVKEDLSKSRKQMEETRMRLAEQMEYGTDLITSVKVAGDAREVQRRIEEEDFRRQRNERKDGEEKTGQERFEEITKKWESALQKEIPQDLYEMLMQQKSACDAMVDEKNKLIQEFQQELKVKDNQYVKDLKQQEKDVALLIQRMDEQVKELMKTLRSELGQVEKAFVAERTDLLESQKNKWEAMMAQRKEKEEDFMKGREKRVEDYEQQLQHLRVQDAEEYNRVKIKLETDVQLLEQQLQQMKATYQLNQEKLEYNFQVLRKRDEENMITKSQQKRKITRLQDVLTNLKGKLTKQEKMYSDENSSLTSDYKKIADQHRELQKKSKHFTGIDTKKFHEVWCMNEDEVKKMARKILEQDRIICEQQLGLTYKPRDTSFMDNVGPVLSEQCRSQAVSAHQVLQEVMSTESDVESVALQSHVTQKLSARLIKQILELLGDESGFLIESKLSKLLQPLDEDEQNLMRLDAIFSALGIETEDDIHTLSGYFMQHQPKDSAATDRETGEGQVMDSSRSQKSDAPVLINPNDVLTALRQFVEDHKHPPAHRPNKSHFKITSLEHRDDTGDAEYWQQYKELLTPKQQGIWDALLDALEKYSETLQSRAGLITETEALRQQNAELRLLLRQYVNSKVNQELEIPPTRVLHLELNPQ